MDDIPHPTETPPETPPLPKRRGGREPDSFWTLYREYRRLVQAEKRAASEPLRQEHAQKRAIRERARQEKSAQHAAWTQRREAAHFPRFNEMVARLQGGDFASLAEMGRCFGLSEPCMAWFRDILQREKIMTKVQMKECLVAVRRERRKAGVTP